MEQKPGRVENREIYEISVLDTTKLSIFQKLIRGERIVFVVYAGKIVISALHTTITKNLGIQENDDNYIIGNVYKLGAKILCGLIKKENGKEKSIDSSPEGINIKTQLLNWFGLKS